MTEIDHQYEDLLRDVLANGTHKEDRTGTGTTSVFGRQNRYDVSDGKLPAVTTKKIHFKSIIQELLWFIQGNNDVSWLKERGVRIWNEWELEDGTIGPGYGVQWRSWPDYDGGTIDQLSQVIDQIRNNPDSRRLIISAWNVAQIPDMALAPCHTMFQFYVADGKLSLQLYQRSADIFLGLPFNSVSYTMLLHMVAQQTGLEVGDFIHTLGDAHIYDNHREQVDLQLSREPYPFPTLKLRKRDSIFDYEYEDFEIVDYVSHDAIKAPVAI